HVFNEGDRALIVDRRDRQYLVQLTQDNRFESHVGNFDLSQLIGMPYGSWLTSPSGHRIIAYKPTLADITLRMPRIATVMYPKDLGTLLVYADIYPGAKVLEAGAGSGATTMTLLRAVGESGQVISYDTRQDMLDQALANVKLANSDPHNLTLKLKDIYEGIEDDDIDRLVLDLPEPWHVVPHASDAMAPGGLLFSFVPTILQVHDLTNALRNQRTFNLIETMEVTMRPWSVGGRSVRPSHRMIGHTGFITTARKSSPRPDTQDESQKDSRG
ncbi:MAG: tRNA (adenine-N1)-methyltransferase, partial [SAR202 cluster bacterium]|nr:tRNA (adenine-N1)-methyltransferase [SAR202 cluster bacterium]